MRKMHPWLQSIYDAFEVLLPINQARPEGKGKNFSDRKKHSDKGQQQQHLTARMWW